MLFRETRDVTRGRAGCRPGMYKMPPGEMRHFAKNNSRRRWKHRPRPHETLLSGCLRVAPRNRESRARDTMQEMTPGGARHATLKLSKHSRRHQEAHRMLQEAAQDDACKTISGAHEKPLGGA